MTLSFHHFAECDEFWHAGDFGAPDVDGLIAFRPGVYGNVDGAELRAELPQDLVGSTRAPPST
jgi:hypothetical protein